MACTISKYNFLLFSLLSGLFLCTTGYSKNYPLQNGDGRFVVNDAKNNEIPVWYHLAPNNPQDAKILFVMHGTGRDADRYLAEWRDLAIHYNFNVLVPEFSKKNFAKSRRYNLGNLVSAKKRRIKEKYWSFTAINKIFVAARERFSLKEKQFSMYGHSAGAQFVHRYVMAVPTAPIQYAIAANAGWYTLPTPVVRWPYGTGGSPIDREKLKIAFKKNLIVLLGEKDTNSKHSSLRRTKEANAQGMNRLERGKFFFALAKKIARRTKQVNRWQLRTVANADHNNALMAPAAAQLLDQIW